MVTINRSKGSPGIAIIFILATLTIFSCACPNLQAQAEVNFSPADKLSIPTYNGAISFAVNGSYSTASLENATWTFMNLRLNGSLPIENLEFSAINCNVTIFSYQTFNATSINIFLFNYVVEGKGEQILNLGLSSKGGESNAINWNVVFGTHVVTTEGNGWNLLPDGTLIVTGASGIENVTILYYDFSFENNSKLPFFQQHSVAITVTVAVAVTVVIAVLVKVRTRKHTDELT